VFPARSRQAARNPKRSRIWNDAISQVNSAADFDRPIEGSITFIDVFRDHRLLRVSRYGV
jgi:hypothetical protein